MSIFHDFRSQDFTLYIVAFPRTAYYFITQRLVIRHYNCPLLSVYRNVFVFCTSEDTTARLINDWLHVSFLLFEIQTPGKQP